ncbi:UNVERIFIED_ORG: GrpB-like predicted nucleotidyltransferase (UPF0157 family) [Ensifer adhaerens]|nr:GrpB-like predicted nucleotidyltransferase (UPF0157 family) [Ensifer adhaerens]
MSDIRLVEYDPFWPEDFAARRRVIAGLLAPLIADIQHVGSTAVPGLAAKPKIDIDAVLQSEGDIPVALESAATAGYHFHGDPYGNGLWTLTMSGAPYGTRLYICGPDNHAHQARILFRDYLRRHTGVARQYELLKRKLIIQARGNWDIYASGKSEFIAGVLRRAQNEKPRCFQRGLFEAK